MSDKGLKLINFTDIYPLNLVKSVFGNEEEARKVYIPGISTALATLTEREQWVLTARFQRKMTLEQCGKEYGITRERIRQIEAKAIRKLRHPSRVNLLRGVSYTEMQSHWTEYNNLKNDYDLLVKAFETNFGKQAEPGTIVPMVERANLLEKPLEELGLSVRAYNGLRRAGKNTIGDVADMTEGELSRVRNLGQKSMNEVLDCLKKQGIELRRCDII